MSGHWAPTNAKFQVRRSCNRTFIEPIELMKLQWHLSGGLVLIGMDLKRPQESKPKEIKVKTCPQ